MANLLPQHYQELVQKERHARVWVVVLAAILVTGLASLFFLTPPLVLSRSDAQSAEEALALAQSAVAQQESGGVLADVRVTRSQIERLQTELSDVTLLEVLTTIDETTEGIAVSSISYGRRVGTSDTISLHGIASTRDELLSFTRRLDREELFTNIVLPVSYLAQNTNIDFSLTFEVFTESDLEEEEADAEEDAEGADEEGTET